MPHLGNYKDMKRTNQEYDEMEVIIAIERSERNTIEDIITLLVDQDVII